MDGLVTAQYPKETGRRGEFVRQESVFRQWVTADGSSRFPAESGRYHLYVCLACPWAHRTVILRKLKKLEDAVSLSLVDPIRDERGWRFNDRFPDPISGFSFLSEAYYATDPSFDGRVTVPILWDKSTRRIVNNESSEIIRMLNSEFNAFGDADVDFYPEALRAEIDEINDVIYRNVNNGVYRCGFATTQKAYESAFHDLRETMEMLEQRLGSQLYLVGDEITEADWRLFPTLVRFDAVYYSHFKCNKRRLTECPNLWAYVKRLHAVPGLAETVNMDQIKRHYFMTHETLNPSRIVPAGPEISFLGSKT